MDELQQHLDRISDLATAFQRSQVLFTANEAGVFPLLEEARTAEEVASELGLDPRGVRMLLDGLVAVELIEKRDGRYQNGPTASLCLVPGRRGYQGFYLRHLHGAWDTWENLPEAVRTGGEQAEPRPERSTEQLRNFILAMAELGRLSAEQVADKVDPAQFRNMLDVGGGPGTYAIVFCERNPQLRATVLDRPLVIEIAKEQVQKAGMQERFGYIPGDFLEVDFGNGFDLVLVSNVIHMLPPDANRQLVQRCYDAMASGGTLVIKDFLTDDARSGPPFSLMFALHMLVSTGGGDTYPASEVAEWTRAAGFEDGGEVAITPRTHLWLARKP